MGGTTGEACIRPGPRYGGDVFEQQRAHMQDLGKLMLRLVVGGMMLFHGVGKVQNGIGNIEGMLKAKDLPEFIAYGVYIGEVAAPILLIIGLLTRFSGIAVSMTMVFAVWLAHSADLFKLTSYNTYALEVQAFYFFGGLAIACLGPGRMAVSKMG